MTRSSKELAVRWTIGDVSDEGFEALRLSVWGAWRLFGPEATYVICVNSVPLEAARLKAGELPAAVIWHDASRDLPAYMRPYLDGGMAEGVGWKFSPLRLFPGKFELALDNDCILWDWPEGLLAWFNEGEGRCLLAEDVLTMLGQFAPFCADVPRNSGMRGTPPGFDFDAAVQSILKQHPVVLRSELDEQGLVTAALSLAGTPWVVAVDDVSICSPFPPHLPHFGRCGAHFVGLNARSLPWDLDGRPASEFVREHWQRHRSGLYERVSPRSGVARL